MSGNKVSGPCPKCGREDLRMTVKQGDFMRVTGGPTLRVTVWGILHCMNTYECSFTETSPKRDIILEFGESAR